MKSTVIASVFCFLFLSASPSLHTLPNKELKVAISSVPDGAEVLLNGFYAGKTPISLTINTNMINFIYVSKVGFAGQRITLDRKQKEINVLLVRE
jgi:hypothetical protein